MSIYSEFDRNDWLLTFLILIVFIVAMVSTAIWFLPDHLFIWIGIVMFMVAILILLDQKTTGYRCKNCGKEFEISFLANLFSHHGIGKDASTGWYGWKYVKCPKCKKRTKARALKRR
jgi:DNA-directed RNA polymerase subunit RPC12/RpoP